MEIILELITETGVLTIRQLDSYNNMTAEKNAKNIIEIPHRDFCFSLGSGADTNANTYNVENSVKIILLLLLCMSFT